MAPAGLGRGGDLGAAALSGCDAVYVIIPFNHPGAAERTPLLLSGRRGAGVSADGAAVVPRRRGRSARRSARSSLSRLCAGWACDWAVLRPTWFLENFTVGSFAAMVESGDLRLPAGDGRIPFVAVSDIADVAVEALAPRRTDGILPLTGPDSLTHAEVCVALGAAFGARSSTFTDASPEEFTELMAQRGFDARVQCLPHRCPRQRAHRQAGHPGHRHGRARNRTHRHLSRRVRVVVRYVAIVWASGMFVVIALSLCADPGGYHSTLGDTA